MFDNCLPTVPNSPAAIAANNWEVGMWFGYNMSHKTGLANFRHDWDGLTATEKLSIRYEIGLDLEEFISAQARRRGGDPVSRDQ